MGSVSRLVYKGFVEGIPHDYYTIYPCLGGLKVELENNVQ